MIFSVIMVNNVINLNFYPTKETEKSNMRHRPVGLGVQGLADVFCMLKIPFESEEGDILQTDIFETLYFAAMTSSKDLAEVDGPYESISESKYEKIVIKQGAEYVSMGELFIENFKQPIVLGLDHPKMGLFYYIFNDLTAIYGRPKYV